MEAIDEEKRTEVEATKSLKAGVRYECARRGILAWMTSSMDD